MTVWRIALSTTTRLAPLYAEALEALCPTVSWIDMDEDGWVEVEALSEEEPDRGAVSSVLRSASGATGEALPTFRIEPLPETDWLALSYQSFPPRSVGRFWIHGSHVGDAPPAGSWPLQIEAATAFGSGEHPTTAGCLAAIEALAKKRRFRNVLDMGTGSGILAVAAVRALGARVTAIDIDPESVRMTEAHAKANGVAPFIRAEAGDGFHAPRVRAQAPYDLLLANILAGPLRRMARDGALVVKPGGLIVLAGLLETQVSLVRDAWQQQGCALVSREERGEWSILVLQKKKGEGTHAASRAR